MNKNAPQGLFLSVYSSMHLNKLLKFQLRRGMPRLWLSSGVREGKGQEVSSINIFSVYQASSANYLICKYQDFKRFYE